MQFICKQDGQERMHPHSKFSHRGASTQLRRLRPAVFVLCALTIACSQPEPAATPPAQPKAKPALVMAVVSGVQQRLLTAAGTVRLRRETALGFTTAGKVASVRVEEGQRVGRGAVLARLDTSTVAADLTAARAEAERANAQLARFQKLFTDGWVTKAQLEQTEAAARAANARVQSAGFARDTAQIVAPSGGIILSRRIDTGQIVPAGMTALILGEESQGYVLKVPMSDRDAAQLSVGMRGEARISALGDAPVAVSVLEIDGRADPVTGAFEVSFALPADARLRSGQLGNIAVAVSGGDAGQIAIPATALFGLRDDEGLVYVLDAKNRVRARNVLVGPLTDSALIIRSGLSAGERIVVQGIEKLQPGDLIRSVTP
jgi:membrane fusion protein (multidrug efflux system)